MKAFYCIIFIIFIGNIAFASASDISRISQVRLVTEYGKNTSIEDMETVKFGSYMQSDINGVTKEPIEWIVLDRQDNKCLLLSKYILDSKNYNNKPVEYVDEPVGVRPALWVVD